MIQMENKQAHNPEEKERQGFGKTVVLVGATGLIGQLLLMRLLNENDQRIHEVRVLSRRPLLIKHPKLRLHLVDFQQEDQSTHDLLYQVMQGATDIVCAVGTTKAKVKGDSTAYRQVDVKIPEILAQAGARAGVQNFLLVSAVGASAQSKNFYLQLKAEAENAVISTGMPYVHIFRPSLLLGNRKEWRLGEKIAQKIMPLISWAFPSSLRHYKPIEASAVANSILSIIEEFPTNSSQHEKSPTIHYYHWEDMKGK